jgi:hypothetical protein
MPQVMIEKPKASLGADAFGRFRKREFMKKCVPFR